MRKFSMAAVLLLTFTLTGLSTFAQTISGKIIDAETEKPLIGATIKIEGTSQGAATDLDGNFSFEAPAGEQNLVISYVGYVKKTKTLTVSSGENNLGTIQLQPSAIGLQEIKVVSSYVKDRETPVSVSTVEPEDIEEKMGSKQFPEMLETTPSVYATKRGGGYGDSRINLRGFNSDNIGVLINGVPVNDMENGQVYWSNWAGLSDVTRTMQVQRGLGASKLAISSVGGTINIITKSTDAEKGGSVSLTTGNNGYAKRGFTLSTGLMDNDWAVTLSGSMTNGEGYVKATNFKAYSYFLNVSKKINDDHFLSLTAFGAPQWHHQRSTWHLIDYYRNHEDGRRLNTDYGIREGEIYNTGYAYNKYHKPQISLNHYWDIGKDSKLSTAIYASFSNGGGRRIQGQQDHWLEYQYPTGEPYQNTKLTEEGLLDYNAVMQENQNSSEGSKAVVSMAVNRHDWYGILSNYNTKWQDINITAGFDGRYYKGYHYNELTDLMGGDYFLSNQNVNRAEGTKLYEEDKFSYYNIGEVMWGGLFGQAEIVKGWYSAFITASISNTSYRRIDYFTYFDNDIMQETYDVDNIRPDNEKLQEERETWNSLKENKRNELGQLSLSNQQMKDLYTQNKSLFTDVDHVYQTGEWTDFWAYSIKGGASFDVAPRHKVFANTGYFTRAPFFRYAFVGYTNEVNDGARHEKIFSAEVGYKFNSPKFNTNITLYRTNWLDKAITRSFADYTANLPGLDALHQGIEVTAEYVPTDRFKMKGMVSLGDWQWTDNLIAQIFDENQNYVGEATIYAKDLKVGDAAQTTASLTADYEVFRDFSIGATFKHYADVYAQFDVTNRTVESEEGIDPWQMPSYQLLDARMSYDFKIADLDAKLIGNVDNILDTEYISDAIDGVDHDVHTSPVFYGFGRTWRATLKINF